MTGTRSTTSSSSRASPRSCASSRRHRRISSCSCCVHNRKPARVPAYERQDIVFVLDRSASMRAHDVAPSRFLRATAELRNFLRYKPDTIDRIGLVGFADASVVLSYLTGNIDSVAFYLDWIDE